MRITLTSPGRHLLHSACTEIVRRYLIAGYSAAAANAQAAAFASRFEPQVVALAQPSAANCNGEEDFEVTLASVAEAIG
jgi:hypothetical protein